MAHSQGSLFSTERRPQASNVEYTISQDQAAGNSAQVEANYILLTSDSSDLIRRRRAFAERVALKEEIQVSAQYRLRWKQADSTRLISTMGQDSRPQQYMNDVSVDFSTDSAARIIDRADQIEQEDVERDKDQGIKRGEESEVESEEHSESLSENEDENQGACLRETSRSEKGKMSLLGASAPKIHGIPRSSPRNDAKMPGHLPQDVGQPEYKPDHRVILHRVVCSDRNDRCHRRIYVDEPRRVLTNKTYHLQGNELILDLDDFLGDLPNTAFIVYRDYLCQKGTRSSMLGNSSKSATKFFREIISVVSGELQSIIQQRSLFAPDHEGYRLSQFDYASPAVSATPSEYSSRFLYHHRTPLNEAAAGAADGSPIKTLVSYMDSHPDAMYGKCDELFSRGMVTQDTLSWLFRPNGMLISTEGPTPSAYVLRRFPIEGSTLHLKCWNWGYDGQSLQRTDHTLTVDIQSYGETRIDQLAVHPIEFATPAMVNKVLACGKKFWGHRYQHFVSYEGPDFEKERVFPWDSRFVVDYQVYSKFHGEAQAFDFSELDIASFDSWPKALSCEASLSKDNLLLLPQGIHGFYLKEKKWVHLLVDGVQPVNWNKSAFEQLVLPKRTKNTIKGLVMVRKQMLQGPRFPLKGRRDDIIAGKGGGLIILLHGGPGTGKTLTAGKSVAELAEMPLYSVTCGDIGTSPGVVEQYLNSVLHLGKKWNCVLLLDEADVFLEERTLSDLERNSLVSVFLRTLEYYDGVLILTSNRVGTFDEAFKSRIQLALHYPPLDAPGRRKIWHNFLGMLDSNDEKIDVEDIKAHMDELAAYGLNGRQIRNVLTTARQLALFENETLDWDRIKDSIEVSADFTKYLKEVHGHTDEEWSRDNNLR
ncbi:hypothetical protein QBC40DRAFT_283220 [Triangularia verruculosa]|uniref:AAA+ ATPase domain-containing protein n=1 Tax=Triangularia verruculosa TaxID=2587418 RepID=A0AAN6XDR3_9PEZI|nr:hypothetical protein QBC40DRAFT_283220 [Triangularia verruculosa]